MLKKLFAISTLLLVLVIGALFVYNLLFKKPSDTTSGQRSTTSNEGKTEQPNTSKEKTASSSITAVSDDPAFGAVLSGDGKYIYYFLASNGQLNQVDLDGKLEKVISTESFSNIRKIIWNKAKNKVIVKTAPTPGTAKFFYLDLSGKKVVSLKDNIDSVAWSNLGDKIIYKYYDTKTKKRTISVSDPDGKNWRDLAEFDYQGVEIAVIPGPGDLTFWPSPNAYTATSLQRISLGGENKKELLQDKFGADFLWSPDGAAAIASCSDQRGGHKIDLYAMNPDGGQFRALVFPAFASKCAWSKDSKNIFCAMPGNIPDSAILPNDWQEGRIATTDTFWKVDTSTGKKERLTDPEKIAGSFDVLNPFLSQDEKILFFINKADGKLYKLALD